MAIRKVNLGKIAIVGFLTVLIWVWSDLALDERLEIQNTRITVAKSTDPSLWVSFDGQQSAVVSTVVLRGPVARISEIRRKLQGQGISFDSFLSPHLEGMTDAGLYTVNVADLLRQTDAIRQESLTVESAEPRTLEVRVDKLTMQSVMVECVDENLMVLEAEIDPPNVQAYMPDGAILRAQVRLSKRERENAGTEVFEKTPSVSFGADQVRQADTSVKIKLLATQERLKPYTITTAKVGYCFSENRAGKYEVVLDNAADLATVLIKATAEAKQVYERQPFHMLLYILDDDPNEPAPRDVVYAFPQEYVERGDIELNQPKAAQARFKLKPVTGPP